MKKYALIILLATAGVVSGETLVGWNTLTVSAWLPAESTYPAPPVDVNPYVSVGYNAGIGFWNSWLGSSDLTYGTIDGLPEIDNDPPANTRSVGLMGGGEIGDVIQCEFTIQNDSGNDMTVSEFHFDAALTAAAGPNKNIVSWFGAATGTSATGTVTKITANEWGSEDFDDFDYVGLGIIVPDGEYLTFRITCFGQPAAWAGNISLDNVAIMGTVIPPLEPIVAVKGNGTSINNGATTTSSTDGTYFGEFINGDTVTNSFSVENEGTLELVLTGGPTATLSGSADFTIVQYPTSPIPPGSNSILSIAYNPSAWNETDVATVSIPNNDANFTFDVAADTVANLPIMEVAESLYPDLYLSSSEEPSLEKVTDIGTFYPGWGAVTSLVQVGNVGLSGVPDLIVSVTGTSGDPEFTVLPLDMTTISGGTNATLPIVYIPSEEAGTHNISVSITHNNTEHHPSPFVLKLRAGTVIASPGDVLVGWNYLDESGVFGPVQLVSNLTASSMMTSGDSIGSSWSNTEVSGCLDRTYGATGGPVPYDTGALRYYTGELADVAVMPKLELTLSNTTEGDVTMSSFHIDAMADILAGAHDTISVTYSGDISGDLGSVAITTEWPSGTWPLDFQDIDIPMSAVLGAGQSVTFTVELSGASGAWKNVALDNVAIRGSAPSYYVWIGAYTNGAAAAAEVDIDGDGLPNVYEYGVGGDPTNSADTGHAVSSSLANVGGTNLFAFIYPKLKDTDLTYYIEYTDNLIIGPWTNDPGMYDDSNVGEIDGEFNAVTNLFDTDVAETLFIRLHIDP